MLAQYISYLKPIINLNKTKPNMSPLFVIRPTITASSSWTKWIVNHGRKGAPGRRIIAVVFLFQMTCWWRSLWGSLSYPLSYATMSLSHGTVWSLITTPFLQQRCQTCPQHTYYVAYVSIANQGLAPWSIWEYEAGRLLHNWGLWYRQWRQSSSPSRPSQHVIPSMARETKKPVHHHGLL